MKNSIISGYHFVLLLTLFLACNLLSSQTLTNGDIFNYHAGDEFILKTDETGPPIYKYFRIIQRTDFNTDSVRYVFNTKFFTLDLKKFIWNAKDSIYSITYQDLTLPYFKNFPNNDSIRYDTINGNYYYIHFRQKDSSYSDSCGTLINQQYCFDGAIQSEQYIATTKAYKGIGVFQDYTFGPIIAHKDLLLYYKKGNIVCGGKEELPLKIIPIKKENLLIYPNPVNDIIHLNVPYECNFTIWNSIGLTVVDGYADGLTEINVSGLAPGMYSIFFQSSKKNSTYIFIKK